MATSNLIAKLKHNKLVSNVSNRGVKNETASKMQLYNVTIGPYVRTIILNICVQFKKNSVLKTLKESTFIFLSEVTILPFEHKSCSCHEGYIKALRVGDFRKN